MSRKERKTLRKKGVKLRTAVNKENKEPEKSKNKIMDFFDEHHKKLLLIPVAILLFSIIVIGYQLATTGDFMNKDVSLQGGLSVIIPVTDSTFTAQELNGILLEEFPSGSIDVRESRQFGRIVSYLVSASNVEQDDFVAEISNILNIPESEFSISNTSPSLGDSFSRETMIAILIAFLSMGLVVFFYFKSFIPSATVIFSAFTDMIGTLAIVNLLGVQVSTAGIAAFLMLIGYSVDTNIMLSTRVLKRKEGTVSERIFEALKTGLTMTGTTVLALTVVLIFTQSDIIKQIMMILMIGLLIDVLCTWLQNAGVLKWHTDKNPQAVKGD